MRYREQEFDSFPARYVLTLLTLRLVDFEDSPILPYLLEVRSPLTFSYIAFRSCPTLSLRAEYSLIAFFFAQGWILAQGCFTRCIFSLGVAPLATPALFSTLVWRCVLALLRPMLRRHNYRRELFHYSSVYIALKRYNVSYWIPVTYPPPVIEFRMTCFKYINVSLVTIELQQEPFLFLPYTNRVAALSN